MEEVTAAIRLDTEYMELNTEITRSLRRSAAEVVRLGYLLRRMMDEKLYLTRYVDFDSYLSDELHMNYSLANRFMGVNRKYSIDGNSERIDERYKEYSQGLLVEMLSMSPELEEKVRPDMTVKQVREIKRQDRKKSVKMKPNVRGLMDYTYCAACGGELDEDERPEKCPRCGQMQDWSRYTEAEIIDGEYTEHEGEKSVATSQYPELMNPDACQRSYLDAFAKYFIKSEYDWMQEDTQNRVLNVIRVPDEIKGHLKKECRTWHFMNNGSTAHINLFDDHVQLWYEDNQKIGDFSWYHLASAIRRMWNIACREKEEQETTIIDGEYREIEGKEVATSQLEKSPYGLENTEYQEESLLITSGCGNKHDCFSCAQDCNIRQEDRYCVLAPLGNPFSCTTMAVLYNLKEEIGDKCQFVNNDLAPHRAGDGEAVPCCRDCKELCGYRCQRAKLQEESDGDDTERQEHKDKDSAYEMSLLRDMLDEAKDVLKNYMDFGDIPEKTVHKQKLLVGALANMVCELADMQEKEETVAERLELTGKCCGGIKAIEFMEKLTDVVDEDVRTEEFCKEYEQAINRFRYEVKKGIGAKKKIVKAKNKGYSDFQYCGNCGFGAGEPSHKYCPNCGTRYL